MPTTHKTYRIGYASGVFDMFHVGHLNLLRRARNHCHYLVVGVASDEYADKIKGRAPVVPCDERIEIIAALGIVDEVVIDRSVDKALIWQQRPFDVIFKGDDWQGTPGVTGSNARCQRSGPTSSTSRTPGRPPARCCAPSFDDTETGAIVSPREVGTAVVAVPRSPPSFPRTDVRS